MANDMAAKNFMKKTFKIMFVNLLANFMKKTFKKMFVNFIWYYLQSNV